MKTHASYLLNGVTSKNLFRGTNTYFTHQKEWRWGHKRNFTMNKSNPNRFKGKVVFPNLPPDDRLEMASVETITCWHPMVSNHFHSLGSQPHGSEMVQMLGQPMNIQVGVDMGNPGPSNWFSKGNRSCENPGAGLARNKGDKGAILTGFHVDVVWEVLPRWVNPATVLLPHTDGNLINSTDVIRVVDGDMRAEQGIVMGVGGGG